MSIELMTFKVVTPPGMEDICRQEVLEKCQIVEQIGESSGLITLLCPLSEIVALNQLRTATRILLQVGHFKARDFPKLYKKLKAISWKEYLVYPKFKAKITCHSSRIIDSRKVEKCLHDAITDSLKATPHKKKILESVPETFIAELILRIDQDNVEVSLNTSGIALYKRNEKMLIAKAPIRENIANSIIRFQLNEIKKRHPQKHINSFTDPMCGAGTFISEFIHLDSRIRRSFDYQFFPCLINLSLPQVKGPLTIKNSVKLFGIEKDKKVFEVAFKNIGPSSCSLLNLDFFKSKISNINLLKSENGLDIAICNPPYGVRIPIKGGKLNFYKNILQHLFAEFKIDYVGIIIPQDTWNSFEEEFKKQIIGKIKFKNGGLPVTFAICSNELNKQMP